MLAWLHRCCNGSWRLIWWQAGWRKLMRSSPAPPKAVWEVMPDQLPAATEAP